MFNIIKSYSVNMDEQVLIPSEPREESQKELEDEISAEEEVDSETQEELFLERMREKAEQTRLQCEQMQAEAKEEADRLIDQAHHQAGEILRDARQTGEQIAAETEKLAFEKGYETGYMESLTRYRELVEEAKNIVTEAEKYKVDTVNSMEGELIELVSACVEKIIRKTLSENDEILLNVIRTAIDALTQRDYITIKINQEDFEFVDMAKERILSQYPGIRSIDIKIDETMKKGDVEIESESGSVNPSISKQIRKLVYEFDKLFSNEELM